MKKSGAASSNSLLRIVDANFNRAKEAMRVAEDLARFVMDDAKLTASFKKCRHDLAKALMRFPVGYKDLLQSRDSSSDVGRKSWIQDSSKKLRWQDLMTANLKRGQEALRVLEELSKILCPPQSRSFQRIRFRLYQLERAVFNGL